MVSVQRGGFGTHAGDFPAAGGVATCCSVCQRRPVVPEPQIIRRSEVERNQSVSRRGSRNRDRLWSRTWVRIPYHIHPHVRGTADHVCVGDVDPRVAGAVVHDRRKAVLTVCGVDRAAETGRRVPVAGTVRPCSNVASV